VQLRTTLDGLADALNVRGIPTAEVPWHGMTVRNVLARGAGSQRGESDSS